MSEPAWRNPGVGAAAMLLTITAVSGCVSPYACHDPHSNALAGPADIVLLFAPLNRGTVETVLGDLNWTHAGGEWPNELWGHRAAHPTDDFASVVGWTSGTPERGADRFAILSGNLSFYNSSEAERKMSPLVDPVVESLERASHGDVRVTYSAGTPGCSQI